MFGHRERYHPRNILLLDTATMSVSAAAALVLYFQSTFVRALVGSAWVGIMFAVAEAVTLIAIVPFVRWGRRWSFERMATIGGLATIVVLGSLSLPLPRWTLLILFVCSIAVFVLLQVAVDVLTEYASVDRFTGSIRAVRLTLYNLPIAVAPLAAGFLMGAYTLPTLYLLSALLVIPMLMVVPGLTTLSRRAHALPSYRLTLQRLLHDPALARITLLALLLQFFFGIMVVYAPLYLLENSYTPERLGILLFIILLPFVLFQYPAGVVADRWLGEKELFITGVVLTALGTMIFAVTPPRQFGLVVATLFLSRIGAALIEIMRDTAFYKHIDGRDEMMIAALWQVAPLGILLSALFATAVLSRGTFTELFFLTGGLFLFFLPAAVTLKDTK